MAQPHAVQKPPYLIPLSIPMVNPFLLEKQIVFEHDGTAKAFPHSARNASTGFARATRKA